MKKNKLKIDFSKRFDKQLRKVPRHVKIEFKRRFAIFIQNPNHYLLNNHALRGKLKGFRSINITGDWRVIYREIEKGKLIFFDALGTHSQLYK